MHYVIVCQLSTAPSLFSSLITSSHPVSLSGLHTKFLLLEMELHVTSGFSSGKSSPLCRKASHNLEKTESSSPEKRIRQQRQGPRTRSSQGRANENTEDILAWLRKADWQPREHIQNTLSHQNPPKMASGTGEDNPRFMEQKQFFPVTAEDPFCMAWKQECWLDIQAILERNRLAWRSLNALRIGLASSSNYRPICIRMLIHDMKQSESELEQVRSEIYAALQRIMPAFFPVISIENESSAPQILLIEGNLQHYWAVDVIESWNTLHGLPYDNFSFDRFMQLERIPIGQTIQAHGGGTLGIFVELQEPTGESLGMFGLTAGHVCGKSISDSSVTPVSFLTERQISKALTESQEHHEGHKCRLSETPEWHPLRKQRELGTDRSRKSLDCVGDINDQRKQKLLGQVWQISPWNSGHSVNGTVLDWGLVKPDLAIPQYNVVKLSTDWEPIEMNLDFPMDESTFFDPEWRGDDAQTEIKMYGGIRGRTHRSEGLLNGIKAHCRFQGQNFTSSEWAVLYQGTGDRFLLPGDSGNVVFRRDVSKERKPKGLENVCGIALGGEESVHTCRTLGYIQPLSAIFDSIEQQTGKKVSRLESGWAMPLSRG